MNVKKERILGIVGSPRRGGNTETLIDEVLAGAKEAGAEVSKIILNDLTIGYCQACNSCAKNGKCKYDDDMTKINEEMSKSTIFVFGTPVYYWGPTGIFKTFHDRLLATSRQGIIKSKKAILVVPLGGSASIARHTVGMLEDALNYQNVDLVAKIVSPSTMEVKDLKQKKDILKQAYKAGFDAVKKTT